MLRKLVIVLYGFAPMTVLVGVAVTVSALLVRWIFKHYHFKE